MIYIHIPFCRSFCVYCGFYSELLSRGGKKGEASERLSSSGKDKLEEYVERLCLEAEERKEEIIQTLGVDTLYIGGGTPSLLPLPLFHKLIEPLSVYGPFEEFTIEVNPEDIVEKGEEYVRGLLSLGANRISMGIQSFNDSLLRWMRRRHDAASARKAFRIIRDAGVDNISIDLIFGIGMQSFQMWEDTINSALELEPEHISAYQLSIDQGSCLSGILEQGRYKEASEEVCREQYDILCRELAKAGYNHYEVSNFALPGYEAKHNGAYWKRVPYVGLGASAHSFIGNRRLWNTSSIPLYRSEYEILDDENAMTEKIMLGLRTSCGLEEDFIRAFCPPDRVEALIEAKAIVASQGRIRIPEDHFFVSDDIIRELI